MSLICIYGVVTEAREAMAFCGEHLNHADERRYVELRDALKTFVNDNARLDSHKIGVDYDEKVRQQLRVRWTNQGKVGFCQDRDYSMAKEVLASILQPPTASAIRKRLEATSDPSLGDCF